MLTLCHNFFNVPTNNSKVRDGEPLDRRRYFFGIFILILVDILWLVSSELTKYIYSDLKLERPFLVTYIRSSLLFVYLIVLCFSPPTRDPCRPADYTQLLDPTAETDDESYFNESINSLGDSTFVPVRAGETTDSDDAAPRAVRFNKVAEVRVMSAAQAGEALLARLSWAASVRASEHEQRRAAAAATRRHVRLAASLSIPWFIANYLYRLSLVYTSPSVATIYVSMSSALAVSLGAVFATSADRFTKAKGVAAVLTLSGILVLGAGEWQRGAWAASAAAAGAAGCYATHLLSFRRELRRAEGINAPLLAGLVGCACLGLAWAGGAVLAAGGWERAGLGAPAPRALAWLLLDAALGPLLCDALWMWGYSLTSPATASAVLGLCIPLTALASLCRGRADAAQLAASLLATAGWMLAIDHEGRLAAAAKRIVGRCRAMRPTDGIRNIGELDEQSEALMSNDEPT